MHSGFEKENSCKGLKQSRKVCTCNVIAIIVWSFLVIYAISEWRILSLLEQIFFVFLLFGICMKMMIHILFICRFGPKKI